MTRTPLLPPTTWIPVPGLADGMLYAYAVAEGAPLVVVPIRRTASRAGPVSEDGRALLEQVVIRGWWLRLLQQRVGPGFYAVPLLPSFWDIRQVFEEWPRRFAGVLYYETPRDLEQALRSLRAWTDHVGEDVDRVLVSLRGTVPLDEIRGVLDRVLDPRFLIVA